MVQQKLVSFEKVNKDGGIHQDEPELRFPEFNDNWEIVKLKNIISLMQSGLSRELSDEDIGVPVIRSNNIVDGHIDISDIRYWYLKDTKGAKVENYFLKDGDLLINFINSLSQIGKNAIYNNELNRPTIFTTNIMRLNFKESINPEFIFHLFNTSYYKNYIEKITKPAVNQASFTTADLKKMELKIPNRAEQEKIARFLSLIDKKNELLEKKRDNLILEKDYYLNNILLKKIHSNLRYGEWQTYYLSEVAFVPKKKKLEKLGDEKLLTVKLHTKGVCINENTIPKLTKRGRPYYKRYADELLIGRQNFHNGGIGIVPMDLNGGICSNAISSFCVYEDKVTLKFLYYYLSRKNYYRSAEKFIGGTGQKEFSEKQLMKLKIEVPSLNEQVKITNFLDKLIQKIDLVDEEVALYKKFKNGLLQKMFV